MKISKRQLRRIIREAAEKVVCPNCGHHNDADVDKCTKCGHSRKEGNWKKATSEIRITQKQLRRIIREAIEASDLEIHLYLKDTAKSARRDGLDQGAIKMLLQDEFMDNFGSYANIEDYEKDIDDISSGLSESSLQERATGNPALQGKERAIMSAIVDFVDEYRLVMGLDPNDFGDDRRVRSAVHDIVKTILGEDM